MALIEGVYENLITHVLQQEIEEIQERGWAAKLDSLDNAEAPNLLTTYLSKIIYSRLSDEKLSSNDRKELVNRIIDLVSGDEKDKVIQSDKILTNIVTGDEDARLSATKSNITRPLSGFRVSNLFTGGQSSLPISSEIIRDIATADRISLFVSFLKVSGLNLIYDDLRRFCANPNHKLRIITTTYTNATDAKAVERLAQLPNTEIRISYNKERENLHAKAYIFERNSGFSTAYIGSSNLSRSAQQEGIEWNIRVTNVENPHIIKSALANFDQHWNSPNFEDFGIGGIERFYEEMRLSKLQNKSTAFYAKYYILPHQKQILDKLAIEREQGVTRNLIVAATGTGKTVISAFDYKLFAERHPSNNRLLFIAHREEILKQAHTTYKSVLEDANFGELWVGNYQPSNRIDHLFISIQTFNSNYEKVFCKLDKAYYDYIVIDEAHHIKADSYRKVLGCFKPSLLIGLTATPERMDGASLLPDFDNKISAEVRLPKALDEGLLSPFQYLCISDETDLSSDELMQGNRYITQKILPKLCDESRVKLILNRLNYYLADETKCKALCFCALKEHARYMAQKFNEAGLKSAYLTSDNESERVKLGKQLSKGEVNYLFVVDIYNEGVDIPEVDTILFLRPTDSLTIFLQQLGRGLRLHPGKEMLTVLDFVAHLNQKYDYASRFKSLLLRTDKNLKEEVKSGFTLLPHGCSIHMEERAQNFVLQNIKAAIYNKVRLVGELRLWSETPTLSQFVNSIGQDIRLIYKSNYCWTTLKRDAGKCKFEDDENTKLFVKGIAALVHVNTLSYLQFINKVMEKKGDIEPIDLNEECYAVMLYYALFQERISKLGVTSIYEALRRLKNYPLFVQEIRELVMYLMQNLETKTFALNHGLPHTLEQYGCYTREEIFAIFGRQTGDRKMQGSASGAFNIKELNTELFFVTLNKSDADFSPSTQYDDYVMGEYLFHWQSQNNVSHTNKGEQIVNQNRNGKKFILFVREDKRDGFGNTSPFYCFGLIDYIRSYGDKPMNVEWKLQHPVMPQFIKIV